MERFAELRALIASDAARMRRFMTEKHSVYLDRIRAKKWQTTWPRMKIETVS